MNKLRSFKHLAKQSNLKRILISSILLGGCLTSLIASSLMLISCNNDPSPESKIESISLDKRTMRLEIDSTYQFQVTINPSTVTSVPNLIWSSSDNNIATVSNGLVKGISSGKADITVKTEDNKFSDTCILTVEPTPSLNYLSFKLLEDSTFKVSVDFKGGSIPEDKRIVIPSYVDGKYVTEGVEGKEYKIEKIDSFAFDSVSYASKSQCKNLESFFLPTTLREIGSCAFRQTSIKEINIPASVTTINANPFQGCNNLESIVVDSENRFYTSANKNIILSLAREPVLVSGCKNSTLDDTLYIQTIGQNAFSGISGLATINIPSRVNKIESNAFKGTGLTSCDFISKSTYWKITRCMPIPETVVEENFNPNASGQESATLAYLKGDDTTSYYWVKSN